jgi:hypothetical protein
MISREPRVIAFYADVADVMAALRFGRNRYLILIEKARESEGNSRQVIELNEKGTVL